MANAGPGTNGSQVLLRLQLRSQLRLHRNSAPCTTNGSQELHTLLHTAHGEHCDDDRVRRTAVAMATVTVATVATALWQLRCGNCAVATALWQLRCAALRCAARCVRGSVPPEHARAHPRVSSDCGVELDSSRRSLPDGSLSLTALSNGSL